MKNVVRHFCMVMVAMVTSLGFVACSDDDDNNEVNVPVSLEGKWICEADNYKELIVIQADHSFLSIGTDGTDTWLNVKGSIKVDGESFSKTVTTGETTTGSFATAGETFTLSFNSKNMTYRKLVENFSIEGKWKFEKLESYIKAIKDEVMLPVGSVNGEMIPTAVPTATIGGQFLEWSIQRYFGKPEFSANGEVKYVVLQNEEETFMTKNYQLNENQLVITGKVGTVDISNKFMVFQSLDAQKIFLLLTKENIADMFVGYGLMLSEGNVSEGDNETLADFKESFMEAFENYAVIITMSKQ